MRETPLLMPKLSMTMESGEVLEWYKAEGDTVQAGDVVCDVMTDKVDMEVEATVDGALAQIVVREGTVAVGQPIAYIATESDDLLAGVLESPQTPQPAAEVAGPVEAEPAPAPPRAGPVAAVPAARRRARELGIDLRALRGTGRDGLVRLDDVEQTTPQPEAPAAVAGDSRRRAVRRAVARQMEKSAAVPQFTVFADLDLEALAAARGAYGWTGLLIRAQARTLRAHPGMNSVWHDGEHRPAEHVGVAVAVDTPAGLIAPVLTDPDLQPPAELDETVGRLADQARDGRVDVAALSGATTTFSNLGGFGVRAFQALVTPPQVCVLSVGAVRETPVAVNGALTVRTTCQVGLTADHRAADGADGGRFLADLRTLVADPERLLDGRGAGAVGAP